MGKTTEEMVKKLYEAFKKVYINNTNTFNNKTMKDIKQEVFNILGDSEKNKWNKNSLIMYIDFLIYAIRGRKYTRSLNKYAYEYFENNLCKDFPQKYDEVRRAFNLHFEYKRDILKKY